MRCESFLICMRPVETELRNDVGSRAGPYIFANLNNFVDLPRGTPRLDTGFSREAAGNVLIVS
jgi:hypothetical protein